MFEQLNCLLAALKRIKSKIDFYKKLDKKNNINTLHHIVWLTYNSWSRYENCMKHSCLTHFWISQIPTLLLEVWNLVIHVHIDIFTYTQMIVLNSNVYYCNAATETDSTIKINVSKYYICHYVELYISASRQSPGSLLDHVFPLYQFLFILNLYRLTPV